MGLVGLVRRWPVVCYFVLAYALSGIGLLVIGLPRLDHPTGQSAAALAVFPVMVVGVGLLGLGLTAATDGKPGLGELWSRVRRPVHRRWYFVLLVPPAAILVVLGLLRAFVSARFTPQIFLFGIAAGVLAGLCEEFGWTGFAYPRMSSRLGALRAALLLGLLWGLWHFPLAERVGEPAWFVFPGVLRRLRRDARSAAGANRMGLHEHGQLADGAAAACVLDRVPGASQPAGGQPRPGGALVRRLRRSAVAGRDRRDRAQGQHVDGLSSHPRQEANGEGDRYG